MNVIVANENKSLLSSLDIDVIKSIDGVFLLMRLLIHLMVFSLIRCFLI